MLLTTSQRVTDDKDIAVHVCPSGGGFTGPPYGLDLYWSFDGTGYRRHLFLTASELTALHGLGEMWDVREPSYD